MKSYPLDITVCTTVPHVIKQMNEIPDRMFCGVCHEKIWIKVMMLTGNTISTTEADQKNVIHSLSYLLCAQWWNLGLVMPILEHTKWRLGIHPWCNTHHSLSCSAIGLSLQSNAMWSNPIHSIAKNKTLCKTLSIQTFDCDQHKQVYAACRADFPPGWKEESMQNGQTTTPTVLWVSNIVICVDPPG